MKICVNSIARSLMPFVIIQCKHISSQIKCVCMPCRLAVWQWLNRHRKNYPRSYCVIIEKKKCMQQFPLWADRKKKPTTKNRQLTNFRHQAHLCMCLWEEEKLTALQWIHFSICHSVNVHNFSQLCNIAQCNSSANLTSGAK